MTREELLLLQVMEECSEVAQAISKRLRFGKDHVWPTVVGTSTDRITQEIIDLCSVIMMCEDEGILPSISELPDVLDRIQAKMDRVEKYLLISKQEGCLHETEISSD